MATTDYSLARTLPENVAAERSILGAILLDNMAYSQAAEFLKSDDFSLDSHRRIYTRMIDLAEASKPIDLITLVEELDRLAERIENLKQIGLAGVIRELGDLAVGVFLPELVAPSVVVHRRHDVGIVHVVERVSRLGPGQQTRGWRDVPSKLRSAPCAGHRRLPRAYAGSPSRLSLPC